MSKPTLLHIDDNDDDRFLFSKAWAERGAAFNLQTVSGGDEAQEYLQGAGVYADRRKFPFPDFVCLDLKMPPPDGFAVLRWIRERPDFNRLPVCILTSSFQYEDIQKVYESGANCFLTKSPTFEKLLVVAAAIAQAIFQLPPQMEVLKQLLEFRQEIRGLKSTATGSRRYATDINWGPIPWVKTHGYQHESLRDSSAPAVSCLKLASASICM
jgi:two-component system, chemotaxis family, response regulator Rcp1